MPEAAIGTPERTAQHVITAENREAFMNKKLDITPPEPPKAAEPAKEAPKEPAKVESAVEPKPTEEAAKLEADLKAEEAKAQPDEKKKEGIRERLSVLTQKRKDAEAETAKERARADAAEKRAQEAEARAKATPLPVEGDLKAPARAEYATEEEYQDARLEYGVQKALIARDKKQAEARAKEEAQRVVTTYSERLAEAKAQTPDYDQRIEKVKDMAIPPYIRDSIFESDVGPRIPLYFADHPDEARRIIALSPNAALREMGKIEAMLESEPKAASVVAEPAKAAAAAPAEISKAPAPIQTLKGTGQVADASGLFDAAGNFTGTTKQWRELRKAGKIK